MNERSSRAGAFWEKLPDLVKALAALVGAIAALAGVVVPLWQAGVFDGGNGKEPAKLDPSLISATATSTLGSDPEAQLHYFARNTLDNNRKTAWNSDGSAEGESVIYEFERSVRIARIRVVNGYAKSDEAFKWNARIREVEIITDDGAAPREFVDSDQLQTIEVDSGKTSRLEIRIESVYPGTRYRDTALTEIEFWILP